MLQLHGESPILLIEYTELKEGLHSKYCDLDTKYMFYLILTFYCKTIIQNIFCSQKWIPIFPYFYGSQFTPLSLPGLVFSYPDNWPTCSSAICGQNLQALPASFWAISKYILFRNRISEGVPQQRIDFIRRLTGWCFSILPSVCWGAEGLMLLF